MTWLSQIAPWLDQAKALHHRLPVVAPYFEYYGYESLFRESGGAQCDLEKLDAAGVRAFGIALANGGGPPIAVEGDDHRMAGDADWAFERLLRNFDSAMEAVRRCPRARIVARADEMESPAQDRTIGVIPLVTSHLWMRDLKAIDAMFERGLRISHCAGETWCRSYPVIKVEGKVGPVLSEYGRELVARMNELGTVLDMAHMSDESTEAILSASIKPVIDGHTSSRTAVPRCRGHSDQTLRKIADHGGVVGIHFADHLFTTKVWSEKYASHGTQPNPLWEYNRHLLLRTQDPEERMRLRKNRQEQERFFREQNLTPPPSPSVERIATLADMADHIEYLVKVMGIEHVGLGGDVNGITMDSWPIGMDHVGELPHLTAELLRRGWSEQEVERFLSSNWLRIFRECLPK